MTKQSEIGPEQLKQEIDHWVDQNANLLSDWHQQIFDYAETAWREYRSVEWYVKILQSYGFSVEVGSAGMPTAFVATWQQGDDSQSPTLACYAEYDAVTGNCQAAVPYEQTRTGLSPHAAGHTDPHSALGISALAGLLAAQQVMQQHNIIGRLKFFGEPAEKVRGSKPLHAAAGYYDDLDAAISFHPFYMLPLCNTTRWDTHCGAAYAMIYSFECQSPETWQAQTQEMDSPIAASHASARAPGANDALMLMYQTSKMLRDSMVASGVGWSMNECILTAGQSTADNLSARLAQIQYMIRVPDLDMAEQITRSLDQNAQAAASMTHCTYRRDWVAKSRPGLPNHALARATYANLAQVGAPQFNTPNAMAVAQTIQKNLGLTPMEQPFLPATTRLIEPEVAEAKLREQLPAWQKNFTSDDYTEYCWHAPTVRLYIARPALKAPKGYKYPNWVMNALGGIRETIDPMIICAGKTIGMTLVDLLTQPKLLAEAKAEFIERTGGGIGGEHWIAPQADYPPPIDFPWPEYVQTARGFSWNIP